MVALKRSWGKQLSNQTTAKKMFAAFALLLGCCASAQAEHDQWVRLGDARLAAVTTSGYLPSDTGKGTFCALEFRMDGPGISLSHIAIHFGNSQTQQVTTQYMVPGEGVSQPIQLVGPRRSIKGVSFDYSLLQKGTQPTVILWGNVLADRKVCVP